MLFFNNLKSTRRDYRSYVTTTVFENHVFWEAKKAARTKRNTLFINSSPTCKKKEAARRLALQAVKAGMTVYLADQWRGQIEEHARLIFLEKNTLEYYTAMLSAAYLYTNFSIHYYYSKPKNQVLIADLSARDRTKLNNRLVIDAVHNRADWILSQEPNGGKAVLKNLVKGRLKPRSLQTRKKNLLFMVNMRHFARTFSYFEHISHLIDYDRYDVTLFIVDKYKNRYSAQLAALDPRIHIVTKRGGTLCDAETARRLEFILREHRYLLDQRKVERFLPRNLFAEEVRRHFGDVRFDYVFNMKFDAYDWRLLIQSLSGKKILFNLTDYSNLADELAQSKADYHSSYDEILFVNRERKELALSLYGNAFRSKSKVALPLARFETESNTETVVMDETAYAVASSEQREDTDSFVLTLAPIPDEKIPFILLHPCLLPDEAEALLFQFLKEYPHLVVFDYFQVLHPENVQVLRLNGQVDYYPYYSIYPALRPYLGQELTYPIPASAADESGILQQLLNQPAGTVSNIM